jgi:hypothetical protein
VCIYQGKGPFLLSTAWFLVVQVNVGLDGRSDGHVLQDDVEVALTLSQNAANVLGHNLLVWCVCVCV